MSVQTSPDTRRPARRGTLVASVIAACALLAAAVYAVSFAPDHYAQWRAEPFDGVATAEVGAGVRVLPGAEWIAQPRVTELVELPLLPPLRNPNVILGAETGLELVSPDRKLSVELVVADASARSDAAWLVDEAGGDTAASDTGTDSDTAQQRPLRTETLASGAELAHSDTPEEIRAVVTIGDTRVRVLARTTSGEASGSEAAPIAAYRPALSALLESLTAG